jgi:hypothetical protein
VSQPGTNLNRATNNMCSFVGRRSDACYYCWQAQPAPSAQGVWETMGGGGNEQRRCVHAQRGKGGGGRGVQGRREESSSFNREVKVGAVYTNLAGMANHEGYETLMSDPPVPQELPAAAAYTSGTLCEGGGQGLSSGSRPCAATAAAMPPLGHPYNSHLGTHPPAHTSPTRSGPLPPRPTTPIYHSPPPPQTTSVYSPPSP